MGSAQRCYRLGSAKCYFRSFHNSDNNKTLWLGVKYKLETIVEQ